MVTIRIPLVRRKRRTAIRIVEVRIGVAEQCPEAPRSSSCIRASGEMSGTTNPGEVGVLATERLVRDIGDGLPASSIGRTTHTASNSADDRPDCGARMLGKQSVVNRVGASGGRAGRIAGKVLVVITSRGRTAHVQPIRCLDERLIEDVLEGMSLHSHQTSHSNRIIIGRFTRNLFANRFTRDINIVGESKTDSDIVGRRAGTTKEQHARSRCIEGNSRTGLTRLEIKSGRVTRVWTRHRVPITRVERKGASGNAGRACGGNIEGRVDEVTSLVWLHTLKPLNGYESRGQVTTSHLVPFVAIIVNNGRLSE